jgi:peptidoglycan glycosyltransferase
MTRQIKILLAVFVVLLLGVVANLSWIQIFGAEKISENSFNKRRLVEEYAIERGDIISADGQVIARSVDTHTEYRYQREYPFGPLFASVTGYDSWRYGRTGLEKKYNAELLGRGAQYTFRSIANKLLGASKKGDSLVLTIDSRIQRAAADALGSRKGAVVALDPKTGRVLAMVTSPTYDPNATVPLPGRDTQAAWAAINADPGKPLLDRATSGLYPPGSSFKVVTASAALDTGTVTPDTQFDCTGSLKVHGFTLYDFNRAGHGVLDFARALVVSCNVTFAQVGLRLGAQSLVRYAELFGFNRVIPFDLPVAKSNIQPAATMDPVALASSSIGQARDLATPLQMAMVAATVANDGVAPQPSLVSEVRDYNGKITQQFRPSEWHQVTDKQTAATLTGMMVQVVSNGTGTAAQIDGVDVAGKTGTAETGQPDSPAHAWFICFAPAEDPQIVVAVLVEHGGEGGRTAAPIARQVLERALQL